MLPSGSVCCGFDAVSGRRCNRTSQMLAAAGPRRLSGPTVPPQSFESAVVPTSTKSRVLQDVPSGGGRACGGRRRRAHCAIAVGARAEARQLSVRETDHTWSHDPARSFPGPITPTAWRRRALEHLDLRAFGADGPRDAFRRVWHCPPRCASHRAPKRRARHKKFRTREKRK